MAVSLYRLSTQKEFYVWLKRSRKESTCRGHIEKVTRLLRYFSQPYPTYDEMMSQINDFLLKGSRHSYINCNIDSLKVYSHFLQDTKRDFDPRIFEIKYLKNNYQEKATMSDDEIEAFLKLPPPSFMRKHNRSGKPMLVVFSNGYDKWTMFFSVLAYSGMRPSEVAHLKIDDIDYGRNVFILRDTKTNDSRLVPIARNLIEPLKKHCEGITDYLFPSPKQGNYNGAGQVFDQVDWGYNFQKRIERLGIKRSNLTVYSLRHSFITRLLSEDVNIFKVKKIVGHKRTSTTEAYTHLTTKDIQKAIMKDPLYIKSNPRGKLDYIREILTGLLLDKVDGVSIKMEDEDDELNFSAKLNA